MKSWFILPIYYHCSNIEEFWLWKYTHTKITAKHYKLTACVHNSWDFLYNQMRLPVAYNVVIVFYMHWIAAN